MPAEVDEHTHRYIGYKSLHSGNHYFIQKRSMMLSTAGRRPWKPAGRDTQQSHRSPKFAFIRRGCQSLENHDVNMKYVNN